MVPRWANRLERVSTEQELCTALRAVPVPRGIVLYDAIDDTVRLPSAWSYPSAGEVLTRVRAAQTLKPQLWSHACFGELRKLLTRLGHEATLREWCPGDVLW